MNRLWPTARGVAFPTNRDNRAQGRAWYTRAREYHVGSFSLRARVRRRTEIGTLGDEWTPDDPEKRPFHDELLRLRYQVFAHADRSVGARDIEDVSALLGLGRVAYTEWWRPIDRAALPTIGALAKHQEQRFGRAADERQQTL